MTKHAIYHSFKSLQSAKALVKNLVDFHPMMTKSDFVIEANPDGTYQVALLEPALEKVTIDPFSKVGVRFPK